LFPEKSQEYIIDSLFEVLIPIKNIFYPSGEIFKEERFALIELNSTLVGKLTKI